MTGTRTLQGVFAAARDVTERHRLDQVRLEKLRQFRSDLLPETIERLEQLRQLFRTKSRTGGWIALSKDLCCGFVLNALQSYARPVNCLERVERRCGF